MKHTLDSTEYFVILYWEGKATFNEKAKHYFVLTPMDDHLAFTCAFTSTAPSTQPVTVAQTQEEAKNYWNSFWKEGAAVDFSACTDPRAKELERRVILSNICLLFRVQVLLLRKRRGLPIIRGLANFILK